MPDAKIQNLTDSPFVENDIQEVSKNESDNKEPTLQKQKSLGSAFIKKQIEEDSSSQSTVKQTSKKPIVGSAFDELRWLGIYAFAKHKDGSISINQWVYIAILNELWEST